MEGVIKMFSKLVKYMVLILLLQGCFCNQVNALEVVEEDNLIKTIITDKNGKASIILQYGKYTIKQMTTTEGFEKIEPIELDIKDTKKEEFTLKDYKIPVPDTYKKLNIFELLWQKLKSLFS